MKLIERYSDGHGMMAEAYRDGANLVMVVTRDGIERVRTIDGDHFTVRASATKDDIARALQIIFPLAKRVCEMAFEAEQERGNPRDDTNGPREAWQA